MQTTHRTPMYSPLARDPEYVDVVEMFVDEIPNRTDRLCTAFDNRDWESLARLTHQLTKALSSYGYHAIAPAARNLESAVRSREPETEIRLALDELINWCEQVRVGTSR